jgi:molybdopterin-binding protein
MRGPVATPVDCDTGSDVVVCSARAGLSSSCEMKLKVGGGGGSDPEAATDIVIRRRGLRPPVYSR